MFLLAATALTVHHLLRDPWFLDPIPYDRIVSAMLNWFTPATAATLGIIVVRCKQLTMSGSMLIASKLIASVVAFTLLYGYYFCVTLCGGTFRESVWWL